MSAEQSHHTEFKKTTISWLDLRQMGAQDAVSRSFHLAVNQHYR